MECRLSYPNGHVPSFWQKRYILRRCAEGNTIFWTNLISFTLLGIISVYSCFRHPLFHLCCRLLKKEVRKYLQYRYANDLLRGYYSDSSVQGFDWILCFCFIYLFVYLFVFSPHSGPNAGKLTSEKSNIMLEHRDIDYNRAKGGLHCPIMVIYLSVENLCTYIYMYHMICKDCEDFFYFKFLPYIWDQSFTKSTCSFCTYRLSGQLLSICRVCS